MSRGNGSSRSDGRRSFSSSCSWRFHPDARPDGARRYSRQKRRSRPGAFARGAGCVARVAHRPGRPEPAPELPAHQVLDAGDQGSRRTPAAGRARFRLVLRAHGSAGRGRGRGRGRGLAREAGAERAARPLGRHRDRHAENRPTGPRPRPDPAEVDLGPDVQRLRPLGALARRRHGGVARGRGARGQPRAARAGPGRTRPGPLGEDSAAGGRAAGPDAQPGSGRETGPARGRLVSRGGRRLPGRGPSGGQGS